MLLLLLRDSTFVTLTVRGCRFGRWRVKAMEFYSHFYSTGASLQA